MTIDDLRSRANDAIEKMHDGKMQLVFPRGMKKPERFPRGELLCENSSGDNVYLFDAKKVAKWCDWVDSMELAEND